MKAFRPVPVIAVLLTTGALVIAGCGGGDDDDPSASSGKNGTIELGSIFSTTGAGAAFGPQQVNGAKLAIKEINADGGVNGTEIELIQRNDKGDPATSADQMKQLVEDDNVLAVLGPTFSNSAAEADPVANQAKTPVLAVSNTGPGIVGDCPYPCEYIFRDSLGEAEAIPANIGQLVKDTNPDTAAIIHPADDPFGESSAETASKAFKADKVEVTDDAVYPSGLKKLIGSKPDAVMVAASSGEVVVEIVKKLRKGGFAGQILGGNAFNSTSTSATLGDIGVGAQSAAAWYSGNESAENKTFIEDYEDEYGMSPDQFAAQAYTGVYLLSAAAEGADLGLTKKDLADDRTTLKKALEGVHQETPLGDFKFTEDHDVIQPIWIVQMDGKGGFNLVKELPPE